MYTTTTLLKSYLGFTTSETADDSLLVTLINAAQASIDSYCKRSFEGTTATRYYDWTALDSVGRLRLDDDLLSTSTGAIVITNGDTGATVITSTQYRFEPYNTVSKRLVRLLSGSTGSGWQFGTDGRISVAGSWGFTTAAPNDIVHATNRLAAYFYRQKDAQVFDVTAMPGMGEMIIPKGMPADVVKLLKPYRCLVMV